MDDSQVDDAEGGLQLGELVHLVQDDLGVAVPLEIDDNPDPVAVRLVPDVADPLYLLDPHQPGDLLDQVGLVHLVGQLLDDDGNLVLLAGVRFHDSPAANQDPAPAGAAANADAEVLPQVEMERRERENVLAALRATGWKLSGEGGAAELLGVKPTTLRSRLKKMGLEKPV